MNLKKNVAILTTICFLVSGVFNQALYATVEMRQNTGQFKQLLDDFAIPASLGHISKARFYDSGKVVVNIQDLHCHPEVQRNISRLIGLLDRKYQLKNVYVEGASGNVSTAWLTDIADAKSRNEIVDALVDQGKLTGSEYYSVTQRRPDLLRGMEDEVPYDQNIVRLGKILEKKEYFAQKTAALGDDLAAMQLRCFNKQNRNFDRLVNEHRQGKISTDKYYRILEKYVETINDHPEKYDNVFVIDKSKYANLRAYLELVDAGKKLHYKNVAHQLQQFVSILKQKLPYNAYNYLLEKTDNFTKLDELYVYLARISREYNLNIAESFPDLNRFFAYIEKGQAVNPLQLVKEERKLVEQIRLGLSQDKNELDVSFLSDFFVYFSDYLNNRLSADDYAYFVSQFDQFKMLWDKYAFRNRLTELQGDFVLLDDFYRVNVARNDYFMKNILGEYRNSGSAASTQGLGDNVRRTMESLGKADEILVVVAGGFHTDGLEKLLDERHISYLDITPNVTQNTKQANAVYMEIARQQAKILSQAIALKMLSTMDPKNKDYAIASALVAAHLQGIALEGDNKKQLIAELEKRDMKFVSLSDSELVVKGEDGRPMTIDLKAKASPELLETLDAGRTMLWKSAGVAAKNAVKAVIESWEAGENFFDPEMDYKVLKRIGVSPNALKFYKDAGLSNGGLVYKAYRSEKKDIDGVDKEVVAMVLPAFQNMMVTHVEKEETVERAAEANEILAALYAVNYIHDLAVALENVKSEQAPNMTGRRGKTATGAGMQRIVAFDTPVIAKSIRNTPVDIGKEIEYNYILSPDGQHIALMAKIHEIGRREIAWQPYELKKLDKFLRDFPGPIHSIDVFHSSKIFKKDGSIKTSFRYFMIVDGKGLAHVLKQTVNSALPFEEGYVRVQSAEKQLNSAHKNGLQMIQFVKEGDNYVIYGIGPDGISRLVYSQDEGDDLVREFAWKGGRLPTLSSQLNNRQRSGIAKIHVIPDDKGSTYFSVGNDGSFGVNFYDYADNNNAGQKKMGRLSDEEIVELKDKLGSNLLDVQVVEKGPVTFFYGIGKDGSISEVFRFPVSNGGYILKKGKEGKEDIVRVSDYMKSQHRRLASMQVALRSNGEGDTIYFYGTGTDGTVSEFKFKVEIDLTNSEVYKTYSDSIKAGSEYRLFSLINKFFYSAGQSPSTLVAAAERAFEATGLGIIYEKIYKELSPILHGDYNEGLRAKIAAGRIIRYTAEGKAYKLSLEEEKGGSAAEEKSSVDDPVGKKIAGLYRQLEDIKGGTIPAELKSYLEKYQEWNDIPDEEMKNLYAELSHIDIYMMKNAYYVDIAENREVVLAHAGRGLDGRTPRIWIGQRAIEELNDADLLKIIFEEGLHIWKPEGEHDVTIFHDKEFLQDIVNKLEDRDNRYQTIAGNFIEYLQQEKIVHNVERIEPGSNDALDQLVSDVTEYLQQYRPEIPEEARKAVAKEIVNANMVLVERDDHYDLEPWQGEKLRYINMTGMTAAGKEKQAPKKWSFPEVPTSVVSDSDGQKITEKFVEYIGEKATPREEPAGLMPKAAHELLVTDMTKYLREFTAIPAEKISAVAEEVVKNYIHLFGTERYYNVMPLAGGAAVRYINLTGATAAGKETVPGRETPGVKQPLTVLGPSNTKRVSVSFAELPNQLTQKAVDAAIKTRELNGIKFDRIIYIASYNENDRTYNLEDQKEKLRGYLSEQVKQQGGNEKLLVVINAIDKGGSSMAFDVAEELGIKTLAILNKEDQRANVRNIRKADMYYFRTGEKPKKLKFFSRNRTAKEKTEKPHPLGDIAEAGIALSDEVIVLKGDKALTAEVNGQLQTARDKVTVLKDKAASVKSAPQAASAAAPLSAAQQESLPEMIDSALLSAMTRIYDTIESLIAGHIKESGPEISIIYAGATEQQRGIAFAMAGKTNSREKKTGVQRITNDIYKGMVLTLETQDDDLKDKTSSPVELAPMEINMQRKDGTRETLKIGQIFERYEENGIRTWYVSFADKDATKDYDIEELDELMSFTAAEIAKQIDAETNRKDLPKIGLVADDYRKGDPRSYAWVNYGKAISFVAMNDMYDRDFDMPNFLASVIAKKHAEMDAQRETIAYIGKIDVEAGSPEVKDYQKIRKNGSVMMDAANYTDKNGKLTAPLLQALKETVTLAHSDPKFPAGLKVYLRYEVTPENINNIPEALKQLAGTRVDSVYLDFSRIDNVSQILNILGNFTSSPAPVPVIVGLDETNKDVQMKISMNKADYAEHGKLKFVNRITLGARILDNDGNNRTAGEIINNLKALQKYEVVEIRIDNGNEEESNGAATLDQLKAVAQADFGNQLIIHLDEVRNMNNLQDLRLVDNSLQWLKEIIDTGIGNAKDTAVYEARVAEKLDRRFLSQVKAKVLVDMLKGINERGVTVISSAMNKNTAVYLHLNELYGDLAAARNNKDEKKSADVEKAIRSYLTTIAVRTRAKELLDSNNRLNGLADAEFETALGKYQLFADMHSMETNGRDKGIQKKFDTIDKAIKGSDGSSATYGDIVVMINELREKIKDIENEPASKELRPTAEQAAVITGMLKLLPALDERSTYHGIDRENSAIFNSKSMTRILSAA